ncbi:MAG: transglycosylase SLT domain-containing protein [Clostridiaceae bacterium]|jgi:soluble lytic murein transglycosylase|nr:transglycosylase SLT domain-containing protein [Clostridiaceae bacterium]
MKRKKNNGIAGIILLWLIIIGSVCFGIFNNLSEKTNGTYSNALKAFSTRHYQNSYYLFSKVSLFSPLKPIAVYHQGECAEKLGDSDAAVKQYSFLFNNYPSNPLSLRARYLAAQQLVKKNPHRASKYFKKILKNNPDTDYGLASEYYLGKIIVNKYTDKNGKLKPNFPHSEKLKAENYFRDYLTKAPAGRLAFSAVNAWLKLDNNVNQKDYLLMAKTAYAFADYKKSQELLQKSAISEAWAQQVKTSYAMGDFSHAKYYANLGLRKYSKYVQEDELHDAIETYIDLSPSKNEGINQLYSISPTKGRDYVMNLKCKILSGNSAVSCYNSLYTYYPKSDFATEALAHIFISKIKLRDYSSAQKIGHGYLKKFPDSKFSPMITFWLGKVNEAKHKDSASYYNKVISKYPDSYYAYRAYLRLKHMQGPLILSNINPQPVVYPYSYVNKSMVVNLVKLNDYDALNEICKNDDFIKSWVLYEKGDYTHSVIVARDAMDNLDVKPDKYDLRWRLVYPVYYYNIVKYYSDNLGNNVPLMLSLMREESHFDSQAKSEVGASGLMQLMPSTASEIARRHGLLGYSLFNPNSNIMLGNYYYSDLRSFLSGFDVSAVAAYNGGAGAIQRWKSSLYYNDTDEFVEQIPYEETQDYVKKVFRSYWNYIRIYSGE